MINKCNKLTNNSEVKVSENKREFRIINPERKYINKVEVDGCFIKNGPRCDYLFEILQGTHIEKVFYVELKGKDLKHAVRQLKATIEHCEKIHCEYSKKAYIVVSRVPAGTEAQILKKKFKDENGIQLSIRSKYIEVKI